MRRRKESGHNDRGFRERRPPTYEVNYTFHIPEEVGEVKHPNISRLLGVYLGIKLEPVSTLGRISAGIHPTLECLGYGNYPIGMIDVHRSTAHGYAHEVRIRLYSASAIPEGKSLDEFSSVVVDQLKARR